MGRTMIIAGHAALPQGTAARSTYDHLALVVEIEKKYGVIVQASVTLVTESAADFVRKMLIGRSLLDGIEEISADLKELYHGAALNAITAALKDIYRTFQSMDFKKGNFNQTSV